jgi:hypothetical protein
MPQADWKLVFGYRHVQGVPKCPCNDPGNYMSMEQSTTNPLQVRFRCWCGSTCKGTMDDQLELENFLAKNGVTSAE